MRRDSDFSVARHIETTAAIFHRLLAGDLIISPDYIEVSGIAVAPDGLTDSLAFFINGLPFDDVHYPVHDDTTRRLFAHIEGAAVFKAIATTHLATLTKARFLRIDASPTGAYVDHDWRHAMWFMNPAQEHYPFPPPDNIRRVVGDEHRARFGMGGATIFKNVAAYLGEMGYDIGEFSTILDWGCGAGRITRYLLSETSAEVHGGDIDANNVDWCRKNLEPGRFHVFPLAPPTALPDGHFRLVIGASVMTHLTEDMQFAWLAELRRLTSPGGLLFLSISGAVQFAYLGIPRAAFRAKEQHGFVDAQRDGALDGQIANADYYRTVWHSRAYVRETWSRAFDVLAFVDGIAALQDFVVLRRRKD